MSELIKTENRSTDEDAKYGEIDTLCEHFCGGFFFVIFDNVRCVFCVIVIFGIAFTIVVYIMISDYVIMVCPVYFCGHLNRMLIV